MLRPMRDLDTDAALHVLSTTRSVRRALDLARPVDPALIESCIEVALQAPTGAQREGWRFVVLTETDKKRALGDLYRRAFDTFAAERPDTPGAKHPNYRLLADRLHEMPALILACIQGRPEPGNPAQQVAHFGSILPAAWSLMVALRAKGLGSTWTTLHLMHEREAAQTLGIPHDVTQTVLLPVAHMRGATLRRAKRRPVREVTYWNTWGNTRE